MHSGWDSRPDGPAPATGYDTGWDNVLAHLASLAVPARP